MLAKLLEGFVRRKTERDSTGWRAYRALLERLLDGEDIDPAEAELVCEAAGKSIDAIAGDLETLRSREAAAAEVAAGEAGVEELAEAEEELARLGRELGEHQQRIGRAIAEVEQRVATARGRVCRAVHSRILLEKTCADPALAAAEAELRRKQVAEGGKRQALFSLVGPSGELTQALERAREAVRAKPSDRPARERLAAIEREYDAKLRLLREQERAIAAIEASIEDVMSAKRKP